MQTARAHSRNLRIPPRKARLAADLIRGLKVEEATAQLAFSQLKGGKLLKKTLASAVANAETRLQIPRQKLVVSEVRVDCGPILKRSKSKSRGSQVPVMKRTSHFTIVVEEGSI